MDCRITLVKDNVEKQLRLSQMKVSNVRLLFNIPNTANFYLEDGDGNVEFSDGNCFNNLDVDTFYKVVISSSDTCDSDIVEDGGHCDLVWIYSDTGRNNSIILHYMPGFLDNPLYQVVMQNRIGNEQDTSSFSTSHTMAGPLTSQLSWSCTEILEFFINNRGTIITSNMPSYHGSMGYWTNFIVQIPKI